MLRSHLVITERCLSVVLQKLYVRPSTRIRLTLNALNTEVLIRRTVGSSGLGDMTTINNPFKFPLYRLSYYEIPKQPRSFHPKRIRYKGSHRVGHARLSTSLSMKSCHTLTLFSLCFPLVSRSQTSPQLVLWLTKTAVLPYTDGNCSHGMSITQWRIGSPWRVQR